MTSQFETMLRLFAAGATGNENSSLGGIDADAVISLAHLQGVWTVVYPALSKVSDVSKYHLQFLTAVSSSIRRNEFTFGILKKITDSGIDVCLLKGSVAAKLYAEPDYRISSDTDILINKKDEKKLSDILKENGYTVERRKKNDHHMKAEHPVGGLMEVHVSLYSQITDKVIFGGRPMYNESWMEIDISGKKVKTLGINDNLMYLTAHYIKHFITGGASVRQMMDLLLYIKRYEKEIDFDKYNKLLKELKYDKLIGAVKSIGAKYFGMDFEITEPVLMDELLNDCESVGLFGAAADSNVSVYKQYCKKRQSVSSGKLKILFWFKDESTVFNRLFPSKHVLLKRGYLYAKYTWLVPVGWVHSFFDALMRRFRHEKTDTKTNERRNKRAALMKNLEMID